MLMRTNRVIFIPTVKVFSRISGSVNLSVIIPEMVFGVLGVDGVVGVVGVERVVGVEGVDGVELDGATLTSVVDTIDRFKLIIIVFLPLHSVIFSISLPH